MIMARVESAASTFGAETCSGMPSYTKIAEICKPAAKVLGAVHNAGWIVSKMLQGYNIVDIGMDPNKMSSSFYYGMKQGLTALYSAKQYVELFFQ